MSQITKHLVDQFVPGKEVPSCQFSVKWTKQEEQPARFMYRIKLLGAKIPFNSFLIQLHGLQPPTELRPQGCMDDNVVM